MVRLACHHCVINTVPSLAYLVTHQSHIRFLWVNRTEDRQHEPSTRQAAFGESFAQFVQQSLSDFVLRILGIGETLGSAHIARPLCKAYLDD